MKTLNISEARSTLPALVEAVSTTHAPVVLLRYGKPAAMIVPFIAGGAEADPYPLRKVPITVADDFDAPMPDLWKASGVAGRPGKYTGTRKPTGTGKAKRRAL